MGPSVLVGAAIGTLGSTVTLIAPAILGKSLFEQQAALGEGVNFGELFLTITVNCCSVSLAYMGLQLEEVGNLMLVNLLPLFAAIHVFREAGRR